MTFKSIATVTPAAVAQEMLMLELQSLRAQATQVKPQKTDYISQLKRELEAV